MTEQAAGAGFVGPLEVTNFPDKLSARVVTPGSEPRVHGYDVETDLCRHYDFVELLLLYLTGELPAEGVGKAVNVALMFLSPTSVAHASVHAAVLARLCEGAPSAVLGVAALGAAEHARWELDGMDALLAWLADPSLPFPERQHATDDAERAGVARCRAALPPGFSLPIFEHDPSRAALLVAILYAARVVRRPQLEALIAFARIPSALAGAFAESPTHFAHYPINVPPIHYCEPNVETRTD